MSPLVKQLLRTPLPLRQAAFWLVWLIATTLMLLPASELPDVNLWDKAEHATTFAILMALAWFAFRQRFMDWQLALWLMLYGIAIECIQYFIPSRSFSILDMLADSCGILPILLLVHRLDKKTVSQ